MTKIYSVFTSRKAHEGIYPKPAEKYSLSPQSSGNVRGRADLETGGESHKKKVHSVRHRRAVCPCGTITALNVVLI